MSRFLYNEAGKDVTKMTLKEQTEIFAINLTRVLKDKGLTQKEVADGIGVSQQTFNMWCVGKNLPRMDKIEKLSDYLGIRKADLLDSRDALMDETLEEAFERRPEMRALFKVASGCTPEEIEQALKIIEALKK